MSSRRMGLRRATKFAVTAALLLASRLALAQAPDTAVPTPVNPKLVLFINPDSRGVSHDEGRNIASLVQDSIASTHKFDVLGHAEAVAALSKMNNGKATDCGHNVDCLHSVWRPLGIDRVATLLIVRSSRGTELTLTVITVETGATRVVHMTVLGGASLVESAELMAKELASNAGAEKSATPAQPEPPVDLPDRLPIATDDKPARKVETTTAFEDALYDRKRLEILFGAELGAGGWSMNPSGIIGGAKSGFDFTQYAPAFTSAFDGQWQPAMNLHFGWTFLGVGAIEAAFQSSALDASAATRTGSILAGVRATLYPLQFLFSDRRYDIGVEIGGGYAFVGGPYYDMGGSYFTVGLTGELYLNRWLSLEAFYRLFTPFLTSFYIDYAANRTEPVQNYTTYWNTLGVGVNFHFTMVE